MQLRLAAAQRPITMTALDHVLLDSCCVSAMLAMDRTTHMTVVIKRISVRRAGPACAIALTAAPAAGQHG